MANSRLLRRRPSSAFVLLFATCALGSAVLPLRVARALSLQVTASAPAPLAPGDAVTLTVSLDQTTTFNGYELFLSWDPTELQFSSATQLFVTSVLPFTVAPTDTPAGSRVSFILAGASPGKDLFSVDYTVQSGLIDDGQVDFKVFQGTGGLGGNPPPVLDNPQGVELDAGPGGLVVIPEPTSIVLLAAALVCTAGLRRRRS